MFSVLRPAVMLSSMTVMAESFEVAQYEPQVWPFADRNDVVHGCRLIVRLHDSAAQALLAQAPAVMHSAEFFGRRLGGRVAEVQLLNASPIAPASAKPPLHHLLDQFLVRLGSIHGTDPRGAACGGGSLPAAWLT